MATIYISDVMSLCAATVEVSGWSDRTGSPDVCLEHTSQWDGVGETDPVTWVVDGLMALAADMARPARPLG